LLTSSSVLAAAQEEAGETSSNMEDLKKYWEEFHLEALKYNDDENEDDDEGEEEKEDQNSKESGNHNHEEEETSESTSLPTGIYRMSEVSKQDGKNPEGEGRIWMAYGGTVYDVTDFIPSHPGGSKKIMLGAGQSIEPYWNLYRQHFNSDLPMQYLEKMCTVIGELHEDDQAAVDDKLSQEAETHDPYRNEPARHPGLVMHGDTPANGEVPHALLTQSYNTPSDVSPTTFRVSYSTFATLRYVTYSASERMIFHD
jgi:cytochrome b involved in lipid metabolism